MRLINESWARNWFELPTDDSSDIISRRHTKHKFLGIHGYGKGTHKVK